MSRGKTMFSHVKIVFTFSIGIVCVFGFAYLYHAAMLSQPHRGSINLPSVDSPSLIEKPLDSPPMDSSGVDGIADDDSNTLDLTPYEITDLTYDELAHFLDTHKINIQNVYVFVRIFDELKTNNSAILPNEGRMYNLTYIKNTSLSITEIKTEIKTW